MVSIGYQIPFQCPTKCQSPTFELSGKWSKTCTSPIITIIHSSWSKIWPRFSPVITRSVVGPYLFAIVAIQYFTEYLLTINVPPNSEMAVNEKSFPISLAEIPGCGRGMWCDHCHTSSLICSLVIYRVSSWSRHRCWWDPGVRRTYRFPGVGPGYIACLRRRALAGLNGCLVAVMCRAYACS